MELKESEKKQNPQNKELHEHTANTRKAKGVQFQLQANFFREQYSDWWYFIQTVKGELRGEYT